jgi:antitoxin HicB
MANFLKEEGIREEVTAAAIKRVIAWQLAEAMKRMHITKTEMAARMHTSRSVVTVGLPEAVYALQVTSGTRAQAVVQNTFDFTEYSPVANVSYRYRITPVGSAVTIPTDFQIQPSNETISGRTYLVLNSSTTQSGVTSSSKNYYWIGTSEIAWAGSQNSMYPLTTTWMNPAVVIGSKNMAKGDVFSNFFSRTDPTVTLAPSPGNGLARKSVAGLNPSDRLSSEVFSDAQQAGTGRQECNRSGPQDRFALCSFQRRST